MSENKKPNRKVAFDIDYDDEKLYDYFTKDMNKIDSDVDISTKEYFKKEIENGKVVNRKIPNVEIYSLAALVGKFIYENEKDSEIKQELKKQMEINKHKTYVRFEQKETNEKTIIKAIAISETGDINILKDENREELAKYAEGYARIGIKKLYTWATNPGFDFETKLSDVLLSFYEKYQ